MWEKNLFTIQYSNSNRISFQVAWDEKQENRYKIKKKALYLLYLGANKKYVLIVQHEYYYNYNMYISGIADKKGICKAQLLAMLKNWPKQSTFYLLAGGRTELFIVYIKWYWLILPTCHNTPKQGLIRENHLQNVQINKLSREKNDNKGIVSQDYQDL